MKTGYMYNGYSSSVEYGIRIKNTKKKKRKFIKDSRNNNNKHQMQKHFFLKEE